MMPEKPQNAPFADSLSGLIERVTFFNEENGWAVLKVKAKGHRDQVTVLGSLPSVGGGGGVVAGGGGGGGGGGWGGGLWGLGGRVEPRRPAKKNPPPPTQKRK